MEVIDDCTVFFLGILPCTLPPTGFSPFSLPRPFSETGKKSSEKKNPVVLRVEFEYSTPL
jgi:hypothetical protein